MKKKLIIWDFDGVISDTEKLWLENRRIMLNDKFNLNWDFAAVNHYLGGMSDKTKQKVLEQIGIVTDDAFWKEALALDISKFMHGIKLTDGIEEIFKMEEFDQCIATGGIMDKTLLKIKAVNISNYFPIEKVFTADLVAHGKPEPDIFLLAAKTMGYKTEDCFVVEDSLAGMTAGLKAGINTVAFLGCEMNLEPEYLEKVKALGIKNYFYNMQNLKDFLVDSQNK